MKDLELVQELLKAKKEVVQEIRKVIVGQEKVIEDLLVGWVSRESVVQPCSDTELPLRRLFGQ